MRISPKIYNGAQNGETYHQVVTYQGVSLMLFDPRPKKSINEIFDREKAISTLRSSLNSPLILIYGLMRVGNTDKLLGEAFR